MNAIETLISVLCGPDGKCCISGSDDDRRLIDSALAELAQAAQQAPAGVTLRSMIEGMSVSVDVSTGDHDAGHRYFGTVTEVMECQGDKHGVTLLVQDAEPNFAAPTPQAAQPALATQQAGIPATSSRTGRRGAKRWKPQSSFRRVLIVLTGTMNLRRSIGRLIDCGH